MFHTQSHRDAQIVRVILADDHELVRAGLRRLVQTAGDMLVVGEAATAEAAADLALERQPDVVLADLNMPGGGLMAIRTIRSWCPTTRVLAVSMHEEPVFVTAASEAGAHGYVTKSSPPLALLAAIRAVNAGQSWWPPTVSRTAPLPDIASLSAREREVLSFVAAGMTSREIGDKLRLSPKSIDTYRLRTAKKLGTAGRTQLALMSELVYCGAGPSFDEQR